MISDMASGRKNLRGQANKTNPYNGRTPKWSLNLYSQLFTMRGEGKEMRTTVNE